MLPFSAVLPMDMQQQTLVQLRVEERYRRGSDVKTVEADLNPLLEYDLIWGPGQDPFLALYQPRFVHTVSAERRLPDEQAVNRATINTRDPNETPFTAFHNG